MNISRIHDYVTPEPVSPNKNGVGKTNSKSPQQGGDKLEISAEARKLQGNDNFLEIAKSELAKIPDIRQTKVDEIKGKVASKYYEQNEIVADMAQKMASSEELKAALVDQNQQASQASVEDIKKLSIVMNRVDRKYYDSAEVLSLVAKGLIKDLQGDA